MQNARKLCFNRALCLLLALSLAMGLLAGCRDEGAASPGEKKTITLTVVHRDGAEKDFTIETAQDMLGAALLDEKLIEGEDSQYGLFVTTVDGEAADAGKHEFWSLTAAGEMLNTGVDSTPIADGEKFELTLSTY